MEFKGYQTTVLSRLEEYLKRLTADRDGELEFAEFCRMKGRDVPVAKFPETTWDALNNDRKLPLCYDDAGRGHIASHVMRRDGLDRPISHVCLKVPTGGGKTLLAAAAVERIQVDYLNRQTGLVLWVIPTDAIYKQTWKTLANREHPYRQMLERASGGRVKMLEKGDAFTRMDVENFLCVMVVMLQASNRETTEQLKMFRDAGRYESFFPEVDDHQKNVELLKLVPNLDQNDLADTDYAGSLSLKHSLGNVLRMVRPLVVIDEGHKAYSALARKRLADFNPQFVLELSATPNARERVSNVLVNVPGKELKDAQMIKLPIDVVNQEHAEWTQALTVAAEKRAALEKKALHAQAETGRYVRPILLVRVERTGKEQRESGHVHAEDAREFLIGKFGMKPEEIRVKTAELDELDKTDLLSDTCGCGPSSRRRRYRRVGTAPSPTCWRFCLKPRPPRL
jgi:type III restriction enzyme